MKIVRSKSIPNVDDTRLLDSLSQLHHTTHTPEGLRAYSGTKRGLVENGWKIIAITNELERRGIVWPPCPHCIARPYFVGRDDANKPVLVGPRQARFLC